MFNAKKILMKRKMLKEIIKKIKKNKIKQLQQSKKKNIENGATSKLIPE